MLSQFAVRGKCRARKIPRRVRRDGPLNALPCVFGADDDNGLGDIDAVEYGGRQPARMKRRRTDPVIDLLEEQPDLGAAMAALARLLAS